MKKLFTFFTILFFALSLFGAKIQDNTLNLGDGNSSNDKQINMTDGQIKWNGTTSKMQFSNDGGSNFKDIGSGAGGGSGTNLLIEKNWDFELGVANNWTASGGTLSDETTSPGFGEKSGSWDPSAASQNLDSDLALVIPGLEGRSCAVQMQYKWAGSAGDLKMQVLNSSSDVLAEGELTVSSIWADFFLAFTCPTTNSVRFRLTSTADAAEILLDNVHLGSNIKEVNISQATFYGATRWAATTDCTPEVTSVGSWGDIAADADCDDNTITYIGHAIADAATPGQRIQSRYASLEPGKYLIKFTGSFFGAYQSTNTHCRFRISDGTNFISESEINLRADSTRSEFAELSGVIEYDEPQGDTTFRIQGYENSGVACSLRATVTGFNIEVFKFPSKDQTANTVDTTPLLWHGQHDVNCQWNTTSSSLVLPTGDATCDFSEKLNRNMGTVSSIADGTGNQPAITFTPKKIGVYEITASTNISNSGADRRQTIIMDDGTNRLDEAFARTTDGFGNQPVKLQGFLNVTSLGAKTINLKISANGDTTELNLVATNKLAAVHWTIKNISESSQMVQFDNLMTSFDADGEKACSFSINWSAGTPSVTSQSGCIDDLDDNNPGDVSVNFIANAWSTHVHCNVTAVQANGGNDTAKIYNKNLTLLRIFTFDDGSGIDIPGVDVICNGK